MLIIAIILFLTAAIFGAIVVTAVFRNEPTPPLMVLIHGSFAFLGILTLIAGGIAAGFTSWLLLSSLILFILAAIGGFAMLMIDLSKKPIPKLFAVFHPLFAVAALILLVVYVLK